MKTYHTYILTNQAQGTLYIGVTSDLIKRVYQHKQGTTQGFTNHYNLKKLVHCEEFSNVEEAIKREKQLKQLFCTWYVNINFKLFVLGDVKRYYVQIWFADSYYSEFTENTSLDENKSICMKFQN